LIPAADRDARIAYYADHGIGWVARPKHDSSAEGFKRAGRFKKASNMNYGLRLSLLAEKHLDALLKDPARQQRNSANLAPGMAGNGYGLQYQQREGSFMGEIGPMQGPYDGSEEGMGRMDEDLEEKALGLAIEEMYQLSGNKFRPWAANGRACRMGEIVLIVDS
jgi:hypothetical protein